MLTIATARPTAVRLRRELLLAGTPTNNKGRLTTTGGGTGATWNGSLMSYDAMGRVINMWACGPATCGTGYQTDRPQSFAYDWAGNLTQESDVGERDDQLLGARLRGR